LTSTRTGARICTHRNIKRFLPLIYTLISPNKIFNQQAHKASRAPRSRVFDSTFKASSGTSFNFTILSEGLSVGHSRRTTRYVRLSSMPGNVLNTSVGIKPMDGCAFLAPPRSQLIGDICCQQWFYLRIESLQAQRSPLKMLIENNYTQLILNENLAEY
jgi:hypothetical protein